MENRKILLVEDNMADVLMIREAVDLLKDEKRRAELSENIAKMGKPNAASDIVDTLISIIK